MYKNVMRYEDKFEFSQYMHSSIVNSILTSNYHFTEIYKPRKINNIYLDTPSLSNYYDNMNGIMNRTSTESGGMVKIIMLISLLWNTKIKQSMLGYKEFFTLPGFDKNDFDYDAYLKQISDMYEDKFEDFSNLYGEICSSIPSLHNTYMREYYMSADKLIRITIDWDLHTINQCVVLCVVWRNQTTG